MTMLGRRKRDKRAKEAAADEETTATEAQAEDESAEDDAADAVDVADQDLAEDDLADEDPADEELADEEDSAGEEADEEADQDEQDELDEPEEQAGSKPVKGKQAKGVQAQSKPAKGRQARVVKTARPEPVEDEDDDEPAGSRRGPVLIVAVLSVVAIALTATVVLLWSWQKDLNAKESAAKDGLNAATSAAQDFSSYDYRTLESNFKTSANAATGAFRQQYMDMMGRVRETAMQQQIVVVGTVLKAGVEQVGAKQVVAVVFLNQETSRLNQPRGTDQYRLRLTVDKVGSRWLVSKVEAL
ncbi:hypothetical protein ACRYCC_01090 [Actinomadura scrupuli]|uniref:hypothetical protein n=1 Tax=Actinomadura scrupuli TaxID=559629 RepID=UPI003D970D23